MRTCLMMDTAHGVLWTTDHGATEGYTQLSGLMQHATTYPPTLTLLGYISLSKEYRKLYSRPKCCRVDKGNFYLSNQVLVSFGEQLVCSVLTVQSILVLYSLLITQHISDKLKIIKFLPNDSDVIRNRNRTNIPAIF